MALLLLRIILRRGILGLKVNSLRYTIDCSFVYHYVVVMMLMFVVSFVWIFVVQQVP
jgi:hypothetical protein